MSLLFGILKKKLFLYFFFPVSVLQLYSKDNFFCIAVFSFLFGIKKNIIKKICFSFLFLFNITIKKKLFQFYRLLKSLFKIVTVFFCSVLQKKKKIVIVFFFFRLYYICYRLYKFLFMFLDNRQQQDYSFSSFCCIQIFLKTVVFPFLLY